MDVRCGGWLAIACLASAIVIAGCGPDPKCIGAGCDSLDGPSYPGDGPSSESTGDDDSGTDSESSADESSSGSDTGQ